MMKAIARTRPRRRIAICAAALAAAALIATGCSTPQLIGDASSTKADTATLVLIDLSLSTKGKTREFYLTSFRRVLDASAGHIGVDVIDNNPLGHANLPINEMLSRQSANDNPTVWKETHNQSVDTITAATAALLQGNAPARGTAIVDALDLAGRYFSNYPEARTRRLIIMSDMVEASSNLRMTPGMTARQMRASVDAARSNSSLPVLNGVEVYVVGAGVNDGGNMSPRLIIESKRFWLAYLTDSGARIPEARYGPNLVTYP